MKRKTPNKSRWINKHFLFHTMAALLLLGVGVVDSALAGKNTKGPCDRYGDLAHPARSAHPSDPIEILLKLEEDIEHLAKDIATAPKVQQSLGDEVVTLAEDLHAAMSDLLNLKSSDELIGNEIYLELRRRAQALRNVLEGKTDVVAPVIERWRDYAQHLGLIRANEWYEVVLPDKTFKVRFSEKVTEEFFRRRDISDIAKQRVISAIGGGTVKAGTADTPAGVAPLTEFRDVVYVRNKNMNTDIRLVGYWSGDELHLVELATNEIQARDSATATNIARKVRAIRDRSNGTGK